MRNNLEISYFWIHILSEHTWQVQTSKFVINIFKLLIAIRITLII